MALRKRYLLITVAAIAVLAVVLAFVVNQWSVNQHMYPQDAIHESSNLAVRGTVASIEENHKSPGMIGYHMFRFYIKLNITQVVWIKENSSFSSINTDTISIGYDNLDNPQLSLGQYVECKGYYDGATDSPYSFIITVSPSISESYLNLTNAQTNPLPLKPTDDTYVDPSNPTSNYGGQPNLLFTIQEYYGSLATQQIVWLKFDLSSIPNSVAVDTATLQLYSERVNPALVMETTNVQAYSCPDNSWTELTLTYSNMPNYNTSLIDSIIVASDSKWYSWNVVDAVRNALNSNSKAVTIVLTEPSQNSTNMVWFASKEYLIYFGEDYSPKLTIQLCVSATPTPTARIPEFPSIAVILTLLVAVSVAMLVMVRKSKK